MNNFLKLKSIAIVLVLLNVFLYVNHSKAQATAWAWAKSGGGPIDDFVSRTIVDNTGNVYVAGSFESVSITIGTITVNNGGTSGRDIFIAKYNSSGVVQWVQRITGTMSEYVTGLTSDASGRIYVVGHFISPSISFPPYTAVNSNTASPTNDMFVTCINGLGTPQWFYTYGNPNQELPGGCAYSDVVNGLYVVGTFYDPTVTFGAVTLNNSSPTPKAEGFLLRFNSNGSINWGRVLGNAQCDEYASLVSVDPSGNPHAFGTFQGSVTNATTTIGSVNLVSYGTGDLWLTKYLANGTQSWAIKMGSTAGDIPGGIAIDASSNVYIGATATSTMNLGILTVPNSGGYDAYLGKCNSSGVAQWLTRAHGTGNDYAYDVEVDANGNPHFQGYFDGSNCVIGTATVTNSGPSGSSDVFVAKYSPGGVYIWNAKSTGTTNETSTGATAIDAMGNVYVGGYFNGVAAFSTNTVSTLGGSDIFLAKIGCLTTGIIGPPNICQGNSATLSATGASSYTWSTGSNSTSIVVTPTTTTIYSVTGQSLTCVGTPATLSITYLPASASAGSNLNLLCKQKSQITATCSPSASSVTWSPAGGLSSTSILTPTATGGFGNTTYTMNVTLSNGCVKSSTVNVNSYAQTPDICQVTVDSLSVNNEIYWQKTLYPQADSFIVYRETSTNVYTRIAGVSRTAFSMYVDTNRSIGPANGDPNLTYYRYKLRIKDSCGNVSPLSLWHETIFIQDQMNGNFNWNQYAIESATSTPVSIYNLKRRMVSTGTETLITSTTGGLASDPSYNSFWPLNVKWFVDAVGFNCNATAKYDVNSPLVLKTKTKSNQSNDKLVMNVSSYGFVSSVRVYPNPSKDILNIDLNSLNKEETTVSIINMIGQVVYQTKSLNQYLVINTSELSGGVYMVNIKQNNKTIAIKKVVIDK